jgi:DNA invertase Pin-like site-specific DNA recombinase
MRRPRYHKQQAQPQNTFDSMFQLPTHLPVAVYYRQSTDAQIGNVSTTMQTVDMVKDLERRGWSLHNITMIDMDAGVSGSKRIDERAGMSLLFSLITAGTIGAVACQDEDRLFRDVTQIQVNIFIEACKTNQVLVITPSIVYDFAHPQWGKHHIRQFRFKSEMAAEYIDSYIRGRLHQAKNRLLMEGRWAGAGIPAGFMVDMRKHLPDGSFNENWRRLTPFEPYAQVVNEYFRLFLKYDGYLLATLRHIHAHGPYYPDPSVTIPPQGFKFPTKIKRLEQGYCPGKTALSELLTNATYIGHWLFKREIVRWNNHTPIVPDDIFFRAFNYLSPIGLDGQPNENYRPNFEHARPSLETERGVERPLCTGMMFSLDSGKWQRVGTNWVSPLKHYAYTLWSPTAINDYRWQRKAEPIDQAISQLVKEKLTATFDPEVWQETITALSKEVGAGKHLQQEQLKALEQVMENLLTNLETLKNAEMIRRAEQRFEQAKSEHDRLSAEIARTDNEEQILEHLHALRKSCGPALERWDHLTRTEMRSIMRSFIERIEAEPFGNFELRLTVVWRDGSTDVIEMGPSVSPLYPRWTQQDIDQLAQLVNNGASQLEIAKTFPDKKWKYIRSRILKIVGHTVSFSPQRIREDETFLDYQAQDYSSHYRNWGTEELEQLKSLINQHASQVEIARAFPDRKWQQIKDKIYKSIGPGMQYFKPRVIRPYEKYSDYLRRTENDDQVNETQDEEEGGPSEEIIGTDMTLDCCSKIAPRDGRARFRRGGASCRRPPIPHGKWYDEGRGRGGVAPTACRGGAYPPHCRRWSLPIVLPASCAAGWRATPAPLAFCHFRGDPKITHYARLMPPLLRRVWHVPAL